MNLENSVYAEKRKKSFSPSLWFWPAASTLGRGFGQCRSPQTPRRPSRRWCAPSLAIADRRDPRFHSLASRARITMSSSFPWPRRTPPGANPAAPRPYPLRFGMPHTSTPYKNRAPCTCRPFPNPIASHRPSPCPSAAVWISPIAELRPPPWRPPSAASPSSETCC